MKSLKELSWNVTEAEYRKDPAFSYSTLSGYYKDGVKSLQSKENKDSEALRFGSLVDCLITEPETLNDRFYISNGDIPSDGIKSVVEYAFNTFGNEYNIDVGLNSMYRAHLEEAIVVSGYQSNWKLETRIKKILEDGAAYYEVLKISDGKTNISSDDYVNALECVDTLKNHKYTKRWFGEEDPFDTNVEHLYQLKFKSEYTNINIRCMFDKIIVNHSGRWIQPIDLKTTGKNESEFEKSFVQWNYWIQAPMYSYILKKLIKNNDYFKDFRVLPFKFVVINRRNLSPCCWSIPSDNDVYKWSMDNMGDNWVSLLKKVSYHKEFDDYKYNARIIENNGDCIIDLNKLTL